MRKLISSLTAIAAVLVFAVPAALANVPNGTTVCAIRTDQSGLDLKQTIKIAKAPSGSTATVTAHLEAGNSFSLNGVLFAPGTPIGMSHTGNFNPNDMDHPYSWSEPIDATLSGASVAGDIVVVLDSAFVTLTNGKQGWTLNGSQSFPGTTSCALVIKTVTNTIYVKVPVQTPGPTVYVNVPVPGPATTTTKTVYKTKVVHKTKVVRDKARFTCAAGDTKTVVYKPSIHTWFGVCYHKLVVPKKVTG